MKKIVSFILPIGIYFIVEWLYGAIWGMAAGCAISIIQSTLIYIRTKHIGASNFADIAFVLVFGLLETATNRLAVDGLEEIVFGAIMAVILWLSATDKINFMQLFGGEYYKSIAANSFYKYNMQKSMKRMTFWALLVAISYAILICLPTSDEVSWLNTYMLIAIGLTYIASEIVISRITARRFRKCEWVPLVDNKAKIVGNCPRPLVHNGSHWMHPVVHLHVVDNGKLLLQLRPKSKAIQPGKWDTAVGGHMAANEKLEDALKRETWEEIGLNNFEAKLCKRYIWVCEVETEYVFSFITNNSGPFETKNIGEVDELRFWSIDEIKNSLGKNIFTPNLEDELKTWLLKELER